MYNYDLFVIGGGSGGVRAARIAAGHGAKVAICEEYRYGGTCVIRGCVPKKMMVYAAHYHEDFIDAESYGWDVTVNGFDWATLIANKDREIDRLNGIYENLLKNAGAEILQGRGTLIDAHTVRVGDRTVTASTILIAVGGRPYLPQIEGIEYAISSNEIFHLEEQPRSAVVVGGGYIAVEFAGILNGMGTETRLVYRGEQILRGFDQAVRDHLAQELIKKGITLDLNNNVAKIERLASGEKRVTFSNGSQCEVDCVLFATGRIPNTDDLGLNTAGVELGLRDEIKVSVDSQTNVPHIYAVGDVTDRIALTPVATMEGHAFADSVFGGRPRLPDHQNVPSAVFSQPPVASVGLRSSGSEPRPKVLPVACSSASILTLTSSRRPSGSRSPSRYSRQASVVMTNPGGTLIPICVISQRLAPLPPRSCLLWPSPSVKA